MRATAVSDLDVRYRGCGMDHLGAPVWRILAACAVLGFDGHQLGDLAVGGGLSVRGRWARGDAGCNVLLQCTALISELSDFLEEDAYFAREGFAEVVQVSVRCDG